MSSISATAGSLQDQSTINGSCNCGQITVSLPRSALPSSVMLCHCSNCRASSGSLQGLSIPLLAQATNVLRFAVHMLTLTKNIEVKGTPKIHADVAASGNTVHRHFCGDCGSAIMTVDPARPEKSFLKGGLFVKSGVRLPAPGKEQFWRRTETWEKPFPGLLPTD